MSREQRAADVYEVNAVLARYCRGVDRADADLVRSCFHETAQEVRDGAVLLRDDFVAALMERSLRRYQVVMHFIGNVWMDFTDVHSARTETYVVAYSIGVDRDDPMMNRTVGVRYIDDFERRGDGEWRIANRTVVFDWTRAGVLDLPAETPKGQRNRNDPSYLKT